MTARDAAIADLKILAGLMGEDGDGLFTRAAEELATVGLTWGLAADLRRHAVAAAARACGWGSGRVSGLHRPREFAAAMVMAADAVERV